MNYGKSLAVMVLVGERMGFNMVNADSAKKVLNGDAVHIILHAAIEREAVELNNQLRTKPDAPNVIAQANKIASEVSAAFDLH
jgi:hypothetical protein